MKWKRFARPLKNKALAGQIIWKTTIDPHTMVCPIIQIAMIILAPPVQKTGGAFFSVDHGRRNRKRFAISLHGRLCFFPLQSTCLLCANNKTKPPIKAVLIGGVVFVLLDNLKATYKIHFLRILYWQKANNAAAKASSIAMHSTGDSILTPRIEPLSRSVP